MARALPFTDPADNVAYLNETVSTSVLDDAADRLGAHPLVDRLGGVLYRDLVGRWQGELVPVLEPHELLRSP